MSKSKRGANIRSTPESLSLDRIHHLLSARQRRYTLYYLYLHENSVSISDLADQVTEWERSQSHQSKDRPRTYNALCHIHVPKLADAAVVTYSQDQGLIELAANGAQLRPYLEWAAETDLSATESMKL